MLKPTMIVLAATLALAACGRDTGGRALSGGLIGAGAGAGISALTGGNAAHGRADRWRRGRGRRRGDQLPDHQSRRPLLSSGLTDDTRRRSFRRLV